jgi:dihydroflavonol-4-reductase
MVLVTGGTGLLGSHLLYKLTSENVPVRALYRDAERKSLVKKVFKYYDPNNYQSRFDSIDWFEGDILDICSLEEALEKIIQVYHCAGMVSFRKKDFNKLMKVNREGTANVVNTCLDAGIEKLCHVSSTAAIGGKSNTQTNETTEWSLSKNTSGYAISKYSAEKEVWRGIEEGLNAVIVNPSVIFGAGKWDESSLTIFQTVSKGLSFYSTGANGFVDARDVAETMFRLMNSEITNDRFLCVGNNVTFRELLTKIASGMQKKAPHISTSKWMAGIAWRLAWIVSILRGNQATLTKESTHAAYSTMFYQNDKIRNVLGYEFSSLEETIQNVIQGRIT